MINTMSRVDETSVYGYVNGKPVYSHDEFAYAARGFGPIESEEELLAFAAKVTQGWFNAGWKRTFETYYLDGDRELRAELTKSEFAALKEMQRKLIVEHERVEREKEWKLVGTFGYADNSVEEVYENKYGERKTVMTVYPHGD